MKRSLLSFLIVFLFGFNAFAQEKCLTQILHEEMMAKDAEYRKNFLAEQNLLNEAIKNSSNNRSAAAPVYKIPVVVHIMHLNSPVGTAENISDAQIYSAITSLNESYRKKAGTSGFGAGVDTEIEFCLAQKDPSGNPHSGINRVYAGGTSDYATNGITRSGTNNQISIKALSKWDNTKYYNVWIVTEIDGNNGGSGTQGYAYFPGANSNVDGSVMLYNAFGYDPTGTKGYNLKSYTNNNRTLIHEIAHGLNLYHTFQGDDANADGTADQCPSDAACGSSGDCVADTPPHQRSNSDCVTGTNACTGTARDLFIHNYMDYSSDVCQNEFTAGQSTRMRTSLSSGSRASLTTAANLTACGCDIPVVLFSASNNQVCTGTSISFTDESLNFPTSWSWTLTGGTPATSTTQNPTVSYPAGTYSVTLTATTAAGVSRSLTKSNYITVNNAPTAASCAVNTTTLGNYGTGIRNVTLNTLNSSSGTALADNGYLNFTCNRTTELSLSTAYTLSVTAGNATNNEFVKAFIDYNNDGDFVDAGENIVSTASANGVRTGNFTTPASPTTNQLLRMRVISDISNPTGPCDAPTYGQAEDYGVIFKTGPVAPTPDFSATPTSSCSAPLTVTFTDLTNGSPTSWAWDINNDGTTDYTTQNPSHTYSTAGTYSVKLTATNATGSNSITKASYITVGSGIALPVTEDFQTSFPSTGWSVANPDADRTWTRSTTVGSSSTASALFDNFDQSTDPSGTKDEIITPKISFTGKTSAWVTFNVAYAPYDNTTYFDSLIVYYSTNCGTSWTRTLYARSGKTTASPTLSTAGPLTTLFTPTAAQWRKDSINLNSLAGQAIVQLKFQHRSGWGNNLYLDNINIQGSTSTVPVADFSANVTTGCAPLTVNFTDLSTGTPTSWAWDIDNNGSTDYTTKNPIHTYATAGTYTVKLTATNASGSNSTTKTSYITVKPIPVVNALTNQTVCAGSMVSASNFSSTPAGATFTWTNSNATIGLAASGTGNTPSFTATNSGTTNSTATITVTPTLNGCTGTASTYTITVKPIPVATATPASSTICSGGTTSVGLTSTVTGSTFAWTVSTSSGSLTGASTGTGNSIAQTLSNSSTTAQTATYTVTPTANGCAGAPKTTVVTVNPTPIATATPSSQTICTGSASSIALTSSVAGSTFAWTVSTSAGSLTGASNGTGNSIAQTLSNSSTTAQTATYTITPTANACPGAPIIVVVTVNPKPTVFNQTATICSGTAFTVTPSAVPTGTTYTWSAPVLSPAGSITGGSAQATGQSSISQTLTNTTTSVATATYTVTPTSGTCVGSTFTVTVTVNPKPTVTVPSNITVCAGGSVAATNFTSTPTGSTFAWTNSNTAIGLAASGTGNIPSFTATNTGTTPITATITVTPTSAASCVGTASTYTITVNPLPVANFTAPAAQCLAGNSFSFSNTGTTGGTYNWSFPGASPASGTGATVSGIAYTTAGTHNVTETVTVAGCVSSVTKAITVYPNPTVSISSQTNVSCNGGTNGSVTVAGAGSSGYTYSKDGTTFQASGTFGSLVAGSYTITVKDVNGCLGTVSATITQPSAVSVSVTSTTSNTSCSTPNGALTASGSGGTTAYTYSINGTTFQTSGTFTGLNAGSYTVTIKDANNCTATTTATINSSSSLTASITSQTNVNCFGASTGSVTVAGAGTSGYTYSKDGTTFQASGTFTGLAAGSYTIVVKDVNNCTVNQAVTITQPAAALAVSTAGTNVNCFGASTGSATATVTGGTTAYTYSWNSTPAQTTATASNLPAGSYTVTVTDSKGCTKTSTYTVTQPAVLAATATGTNVNCFGTSTGSATVTVSGGTTTYTYSWNSTPVQTTATASNLPAGSYTVTVTDSKGCTTGASYTVTQPAALAVTASGTNVNCFGASTGSASATVSGGTTAYTYSWNTTPAQTTATASNLSAGAYTVTVTDSKGCTKTASYTVTQPASALSVGMMQTNVSCNGGNTGSAMAMPSGGTTTYIYSWNTTPVQTTQTATGLAAGTYVVTVTDSKGCTSTGSATITQPAALAVTATGTNVNCFGASTGTATATSSGGTTAYTYSWNSTPAQTTASASNLPAGSYTVTVTDSKGCTKTASYTVTQPTALAVTTSGTNATCFGASTGSATATVSGGTTTYTYSWNSTPAQTTSTASNLPAGSYTVTVTDSKGCTKTGTYTVTQPSSAVSVSATTTSNTSCATPNGTISASGSGGIGGYTYSINGTTFQASGSFTGLNAGSYTVTVKDANNCTSTTTATVGSSTSLSASITSQTNVLCFSEKTGSLTVTASGSSGYSYSINGTTFQASSTFNTLPAGSYTIIVKDVNSCVVNVTATISQPTQVTVSATKTDATCGAANGSITATGANGTAGYTYSIDGTTFQASGSFNALASGNYTVTVKDANGCTNTTNVTVNNIGLSAAVTAQTNVSCNAGNDGSVTVTSTGSSGYSYSIDGTTFQSSGTFSNLAAGNYTIIAKDVNSCTVPVMVNISEPSLLTISTTSVSATCGNSNGSATANISGGSFPYTYSWSSTTQTGSTAYYSAGTYTVTVTDLNGCSSSSTITINNIPGPSITVTPTHIKCFGDSTGEALVNITGGTAPYFYSWSNSQIANPAINLEEGDHAVTVTDANGCSVSVTTQVFEPSELQLFISNSDTICLGQSIQISASGFGGTSGYSYSWNNGLTGSGPNTVSPTTTTTYSVNITDANGCTLGQDSTIIITVLDTPVANFTSSQNAMDVTFVNNTTDATSYTWDFGDGSALDNSANPTHTYATPGVYPVTLIADGPCGADTITQQITVINVGLASQAKSDVLNVYPNPSKGLFNLVYENSNVSAVEVKIVSGTGQLIFDEKLTNLKGKLNSTYDLSEYAKGVYTLQIISDKEVKIQRLILN